MNLRATVTVLGLFVAIASLAAEFQAGFAAADITPPVGWRRARPRTTDSS